MCRVLSCSLHSFLRKKKDDKQREDAARVMLNTKFDKVGLVVVVIVVVLVVLMVTALWCCRRWCFRWWCPW